MSKKKNQKKGKEQAARKRRVTPRQLMTGWIAVVVVGTGAWYALAAMPDANTIKQLESNARRAETRLEENRERVAELQAEIDELTAQVSRLDAEYSAYSPYVGTLSAASDYGEALAATLTEAGLEVTQVEAPTGWTAHVAPYHSANFTLDATGTYEMVTTALRALEAQPGVSVRELQIVKNGGDPNDPILTARYALQAHVKSDK